MLGCKGLNAIGGSNGRTSNGMIVGMCLAAGGLYPRYIVVVKDMASCAGSQDILDAYFE